MSSVRFPFRPGDPSASAEPTRRHIVYALGLAAAGLIGTPARAAKTKAKATPLPQARPQGAAPARLRLALNRPIDGTALPYLEALAGGAFSANNVDVALTSEGSSAEVMTAIGRGVAEIGVADLGALIRFRANADHAPVKAVFVVYNASPHAIIARKSRGITALQDLVGKTLGVTTDNDVDLQWPALAALNNIDPKSVNIENVSAAVREPMLSAGQLDAVTGLSFRTPIDLKDRGVPADDLIVLRAAEYGYPLYGDVVVVNPDFAQKNPDAVRRFLAGLAQGLGTAIAQPAATAARTLKIADPATRAIELERWKSVLADCILTAAAKREGLGRAEPERVTRSIALVLGSGGEPALTAAALYDDTFLPSRPTPEIR